MRGKGRAGIESVRKQRREISAEPGSQVRGDGKENPRTDESKNSSSSK